MLNAINSATHYNHIPSPSTKLWVFRTFGESVPYERTHEPPKQRWRSRVSAETTPPGKASLIRVPSELAKPFVAVMCVEPAEQSYAS
jgi:hypothetical protein